ncbi:MAG: 4-(cytidine 5'-diphospho)-2-C-methyl-D-erythritol kinase [Muribaculaceae bacterium]|nr:4-(cytidine 5'-diphospho)-2-C-methyl-D-erythritol kinase [Muribaculaceae bacterium]
MILFPNPKINIGLNILSRRPDGYHEIATVFYPVLSMTDILEIVEVPAGKPTSLTVTGNHIDCHEEDNLVFRAFRLIKELYEIPNVEIHLHKIIPDGAGLGGGSADAAFMLKGLNEMFALDISDTDLANIAAHLGADCPFFIYNRPMYATGIGTDLSPIDIDLTDYEIRIEKPDVYVSTKEAYACVTPKKPDVELIDAVKLPVDKWSGIISNDFENSIFPSHSEISEVKRRFYDNGAVYASMSGSGSAVYGLFKKETRDS